MTRRCLQPTLLFMALTLVSGCAGTPARGPAPQESPVEAGRRALEENRFDDAYRIFQGALERANTEGSRRRQSDFQFYLGLTKQLQAESDAEPEPLLERALTHYASAISLTGHSAAAHNNMAEILVALGRKEEALEHYHQAVGPARRRPAAGGEDDPRRAFYAANCADLYASLENPEQAAVYYRKALELQPDNTRAHEGLVQTLLSMNPNDLLLYLWDAVESGGEIRALDAVRQVAGDGRWRARQKEELLTIVVVSLSKQFYEPGKFFETDLAGTVDVIGTHPGFGTGTVEIMRLHDLPVGSPSEFSWWADFERGRPFEEHPRGVWPRDGFRMLIRSLGDRYRRTGQTDLAESYYDLSTKLDENDPPEIRASDPVAFLRLADMYVAKGDKARLENLAAEYVPDLFSGKANAYRRSLVDKIYDYHRALGVLYANIGQWGDSNVVTSAVFQLEHASRTADFINERARTDAEKVRFEPRLVDYLADAYAKKDNPEPEKAFQLRLDAAERYISAGDSTSTRAVLKGVDLDRPPPNVSPNQIRRIREFLGRR